MGWKMESFALVTGTLLGVGIMLNLKADEKPDSLFMYQEKDRPAIILTYAKDVNDVFVEDSRTSDTMKYVSLEKYLERFENPYEYKREEMRIREKLGLELK